MSDAPQTTPRRGWWTGLPSAPGLTRQLFVLVGLSGLAISQPLLSVLGDNPTLFTFHDVTGGTLVLYAVMLVLLPPVVLWLPAVLVNLAAPGWTWIPHTVAVSTLVALAAVQWADQLGVSSTLGQSLVLVAAFVGFAVCYLRWEVASRWASYLAILAPLSLGQFVFTAPSSDVVFPPDEPVETSAATTGTPVVLVILDELPTLSLIDDSGSIDPVRFPNLAAFADEATWYPNYTSTSPLTETAVPALLVGGEPRPVEPLYAEYPDNLFTRLAPTHHLAVFESFIELCAFDDCTEEAPGGTGGRVAAVGDLTDKVLTVWLDRVVPGREPPLEDDEFTEELIGLLEAGASEELAAIVRAQDRARPARLVDFVDSFRPGVPSLYYLHLLLPHQPFHFYADGTLYDVDDDPAERSNATPWLSALTEQRHLSQAAYVDSLIGDVVGALRDEGLYDEALVLFTADHGASFAPGTPFRRVTADNAAELGFVPLLIKRPGQSGGSVDESNVTAADIVPTIADVVGFEPPAGATGAAIGGPEIAQRGDDKEMYDHHAQAFGAKELSDDTVPFSSADRPTSTGARNIGPLLPGEEELAGLHRRAGVDHLVGASYGDLVIGEGGTVLVEELEGIQAPSDDLVGIVQGRVENAPEGAVVVAIDGTVVAGSERFAREGANGLFAALLPADVVSGNKTVQIGVVVDGGIHDLEVRDA